MQPRERNEIGETNFKNPCRKIVTNFGLKESITDVNDKQSALKFK